MSLLTLRAPFGRMSTTSSGVADDVGWTPDTLFSGGESGEWWITSDLGSLWTTAGKTVNPDDTDTVTVWEGQRGAGEFDFASGTSLPSYAAGGGYPSLSFATSHGRTSSGAFSFSDISYAFAVKTPGLPGRTMLGGIPQNIPWDWPRWRAGIGAWDNYGARARYNGTESLYFPLSLPYTTGVVAVHRVGNPGVNKLDVNDLQPHSSAAVDITYPNSVPFLVGGHSANVEFFAGSVFGAFVINRVLDDTEVSELQDYFAAQMNTVI